MNNDRSILQIVPRAPGGREGVGDYAGILSAKLEENYGYRTIFATAAELVRKDWRAPAAIAVVLHYVNYGYDPRGVPSWLPRRLEEIQRGGGRLITIFHELYAERSWRRSAFWLQPWQKRIARAIAKRSALCLVSSAVLADQLRALTREARILVRPVISTFGEPKLTAEQINNRSPQRWVICGGTDLVLRSLKSFPGKGDLYVVGGAEQSEIRRVLDQAHYLPDVEAEKASAVLSSCSYGWLDYFESSAVPTAAILKSTAFAAYCAHGVIPVFPLSGSTIALGADALPGPFYPENLPSESARPEVAQATYDWYGRNASSAHLAATVAEAIAS
ncbi:MAG: hypothetical protein H0X40_12620 [Chthoniobacterales bacterium]|nr:hypothetical protein [Chthoniobacterales bacterium]